MGLGGGAYKFRGVGLVPASLSFRPRCSFDCLRRQTDCPPPYVSLSSLRSHKRDTGIAFHKLVHKRQFERAASQSLPSTSANMSDFNFGGTEEESAEIKKLNADVVRCAILNIDLEMLADALYE